MRWYILRTLLLKELRRHLANRGGIVLALLLICMAIMLSVFGKQTTGLGSSSSAGPYVIDYWNDDPWIEYLRAHVPDEWRRTGTLVIRNVETAPTRNGIIAYDKIAAVIQIRPRQDGGKGPPYLLWFWYSPAKPDALGPLEAWFRKETQAYSDAVVAAALEKTSPTLRGVLPFRETEERRTPFSGAFDPQAGMATILVLFSLIFSCLYLLPSMTCEERERGLLLAQMLSPASASEVLAGKFLFYPVLGITLGAVLAGICGVAALAIPFFWLSLAVIALGCVGVGLTIASLARTQRMASLGAMCYLLVVALLILTTQQYEIPVVPWLLLEFHAPRMLHAALTDTVATLHWAELGGTTLLALGWAGLAIFLFRRWGWQ